jgi:hypothetical protein
MGRMEIKTKRPRPKHYEPKLSLYPMTLEEAVRKIGKVKPKPAKQKVAR